MAEDAEIELSSRSQRSGRTRTLLRIGAGAAAVAAVLLGGLWLARKPIANHFIAQALREKGVQGRYDLIRIGPRTQRLENLVLGDPARPDLTASWIEVDLGYGFSGVRVSGLRAEKVRLQASYSGGKLDLGSVGKLMGEGDSTAALPDIKAELNDIRAHVATDGGPVDFAVDGVGNLSSGFIGQVKATAAALTFGGCKLDNLSAEDALTTESGQVHVKGPIQVQSLSCPENKLVVARPKVDADLRTDPAMSDINAALALSADNARLADRLAQRLSGLVTIKGTTEQLDGNASLSAERTELGGALTGSLKIGGRYALRPRGKDQDYSYAAVLTAEDIRPTSSAGIRRLQKKVAGTPLEPLAGRLAEAVINASAANRLSISGRLSGQGKRMQVLVSGGQFSSGSGARVETLPESRVAMNLPEGKWTADGGLSMRGGDLPEAELIGSTAEDGGLSAKLTMQDYRAGSARLGLAPVHLLRTSAGAMRINTIVSLDGPIGDGAVRGLVVPLDVSMTRSGALRVPRDCAPLRWRALKISSVALEPTQLDLCGLDGKALHVTDIALLGRIGDSPLRLTADTASYTLDSGRFDLTALDARIGAGEQPVLLQADALDGALGQDGAFAGALKAGHAVIGPVPLDLSGIEGQWHFSEGTLALDGAMRVTDRQADARFEPVLGQGVHLELADGAIEATGRLVNADRKVDFATVTLHHDLGSGNGQADFALDHLVFGNALQPDDMTQMAQGVVALVEGRAEGKGTIRWTGEGAVTSEGTFSTNGMNFAAAFGPVEGFTTTIHFTDLLGLKTAPHQHMSVKKVSAGVDVFDGEIDYALLSNEAAQIEGGRWPFSGGTLELLPAMLNLDARRPRNLTFRVTGIDAGAFIQTLELDNVSATGTFDGLLPMIFDERGGRIEGGILVARQQDMQPLVLSGGPEDAIPACDTSRQAGTLSYVGPVSNAELGTMGKMAFNVLKHLGYRCLTIRLDGSLDGEFVTQIRANGINLVSEEARRSLLVRPFLKLPFIFNVRIEAPFRGLMSTAASLADPNQIVRQQLNGQIPLPGETGLAVQPADSDKTIEGSEE